MSNFANILTLGLGNLRNDSIITRLLVCNHLRIYLVLGGSYSSLYNSYGNLRLYNNIFLQA